MAAGLLGVVLVVAGCARQERPPGAEVDNTPPRLQSIRPEDGAVVPGLDRRLTLTFDEPVSERQGLQRDLVASPAYRYRVEFGFSTIEIEPREGWRDGVVYFFRIPPPFTDVLGNRREEPVEVTFSTGPPIPSTRVDATVRDRVTGEQVRDARVLFYRTDGDSVPYTAVRDTGRTHRLAALPPDTYRAWAFRDLNGNMRLEARLEAHDSTTFELEADASETLEFRVVEPDSTAPVLASAAARDSLLLELEFDDPLDPEQDFGAVDVAVRDTATGRTWPVTAVGLTPEGVGRDPGRGDRREGAAPPPDAPPADVDTAAPPDGPGNLVGAGEERDTVPPADTAPAAAPEGREEPAPEDTAGADRRGGGGEPAETPARRDTAPLPSRTALVRLERPLEDGAGYRVRADGFENLRGLTGGGDTVFVYTATQDTAPLDTTRQETPPADTTGVPPDTAGEAVRADTAEDAVRGRDSPDAAPRRRR